MDKIVASGNVTAIIVVILAVISFVLWTKARKKLRHRRVYDLKFFIKNGLEQVLKISMVSANNKSLCRSIGIWESQLQYLLERASIEELLFEIRELEEEIQTVTNKEANTITGRALTGFERLLLGFEGICHGRSEAHYNEDLNELKKEFLEWWDAMREIEKSIREEEKTKRSKVSSLKDVGRKQVQKKTAQK